MSTVELRPLQDIVERAWIFAPESRTVVLRYRRKFDLAPTDIPIDFIQVKDLAIALLQIEVKHEREMIKKRT
jgi:hypothetical protein